MANFYTNACWTGAFLTHDAMHDTFLLDGRAFLDESVRNESAI